MPLRYVLPEGVLDYSERSIDSPDRLTRALEVLARSGVAQADLGAFGPGRDDLERLEHIERAHDAAYVEGLMRTAPSGPVRLDPELELDEPILAAALSSSSQLWRAAKEALDGKGPLLVLSRPGSHHAERAYALGHCLVNHLAVAACWALSEGLRVAVFDLDAHHGNGTESILRSEGGALVVSLHQYPFFPGTGAREDRGRHDNVCNLPLPAGTTGGRYRRAFDEALGRLGDFAPDLLLVEAGFDAHGEDWTSDLDLDDEDFNHLGRRLGETLAELELPAVFELGGAYSRGSLEGGLASWLNGLRGLPGPAREPGPRHVERGKAPSLAKTNLAAGLCRLREHGLLVHDVYPYAARFGAFLRPRRPDLEAAFTKTQAAQLPLAQARDFAFLAFAEAHAPSLEIDRALLDFAASAPFAERLELANTLSWYAREVSADNTP